ncbi:MAG: AmmeMemoRadiSam system protein B [Deltaproteobacteria bacterium]
MGKGTVRIRRAAVAGTFYPASERELESAIAGYLEEALAAGGDEYSSPPKALVVPHAGYIYSGAVAATAYARLLGTGGTIERVVLLGPAHRVPVRAIATSNAEAFETPLGQVGLDRRGLARALELDQVEVDDQAHTLEHSLEVHLPFLQTVLGHFLLLPFAVGDATDEEVAELLELLWGGPETLILISSDLSHHYDYDTARQMDAATTQAIREMEPGVLGRESACGRVPLRGFLVEARQRGLHCQVLDVRNSGDTAGSRDSVVGYGSYAFF